MRQSDVDEHLGPVGVWEELLFDQPHAKHRDEEQADDRPRNDELVLDRPDDHTAELVIAGRFIDRCVSALHRLNVWEQLDAEIGGKGDGDNPRCEQCNANYPEEIANVFTDA